MANIFKRPSRQWKLTVSQKGNGQFQTLQAAIDCAATFDGGCEILIEEGIYEEMVKIYSDRLSLIGNGNVRITAEQAATHTDKQGNQLGTFRTATVFINGKDIYFENIHIVNRAGNGNEVGQAVSAYFEGTNLRFVSCIFDAHQDTLCFGPLPKKTKEGTALKSPWVRRLYSVQKSIFFHCHIQGTVDFIFGGGTALFDSCKIHCKSSPQTNFIAAASTACNQEGFTFVDCHISGDKEYYLGRPWRNYARTTFKNCRFDHHLIDSGWSDWQRPHESVTFCEENCLYAKPPLRDSWITIKGARYGETKN